MKSRVADEIMSEYNRKKRYIENKEFSELQVFIKENCKNCKNRKTDLCHIVRNANNQLNCAYKE